MTVPTAKAIYEAAEQAIYDLVVDGKSSANCMGKAYTANDLKTLHGISEFYRGRAIDQGLITADISQQKVAVSHARIRNCSGGTC